MRPGTDSELVRASLGAVASLALLTLVGLLVGFDLTWTLRQTNATRLFHYAVAAGAVGPLAVVAWRRSARVSAVGGVLAVLAGVLIRSPGDLPQSLARLNVGLTAYLVVFVLAAAVEYALRNPGTVRSVFTRRAVTAGVAAGVLHLAVVLALRPWLGLSTAYLHVPGNVLVVIWSAGGVFLLGLGAGVAAVRFGLVTPPLVVAGTFAWATYGTWLVRESLRTGDALAGVPLSLYWWLWFVVLGAALAAGGIERGLRRHFRGPSSTRKTA